MLKFFLNSTVSLNDNQAKESLKNIFKEIGKLNSDIGTVVGVRLLYAIRQKENKNNIKAISILTNTDVEEVEKVIEYLRKPKNKKPIAINVSGRVMTSGEYNSRF